MNAQRNIRCQIISIDDRGRVETTRVPIAPPRNAAAPRFRPSDMVPWADPYISGLVKRLQAEVRSEVRDTTAAPAAKAPAADLECPWDEPFIDHESTDREPLEAVPAGGESWNRGDRFNG